MGEKDDIANNGAIPLYVYSKSVLYVFFKKVSVLLQLKTLFFRYRSILICFFKLPKIFVLSKFKALLFKLIHSYFVC